MKLQTVLKALLILMTTSAYALPQEKPPNSSAAPASSQKPLTPDKPVAPSSSSMSTPTPPPPQQAATPPPSTPAASTPPPAQKEPTTKPKDNSTSPPEQKEPTTNPKGNSAPPPPAPAPPAPPQAATPPPPQAATPPPSNPAASPPPPAQKEPTTKPKDNSTPPPEQQEPTKPKDSSTPIPSTEDTPTTKKPSSPSSASSSSSSDGEKSGDSNGGINVFTAPIYGVIDISGPVKLTWTPGTKGSVTLLLVKGSDRQKQVSVVAASIDNSGSYTWEPPSTIKPESATEQYLFKITDDNNGTTNYSLEFEIEGADGNSASKTTSTSPRTSDKPAESKSHMDANNRSSGGPNMRLIVGAAVGVVALVIGLVVAGRIACVMRRRRKKLKMAARTSEMMMVEREYTQYMKRLEGQGVEAPPPAVRRPERPKEDLMDMYGKTRGMLNAF